MSTIGVIYINSTLVSPSPNSTIETLINIRNNAEPAPACCYCTLRCISRQGSGQQRGHRALDRGVLKTACGFDARVMGWALRPLARVEYSAVLYSAHGGRPAPPQRCSGQQLCFVSAPHHLPSVRDIRRRPLRTVEVSPARAGTC